MDIISILLPFILLTCFLIIGMPVAFALIGSSIVEIAIIGNFSLFNQVPTVLYNAFSNYTLLAIPYFILVGEILSRGKIIDLLFDLISGFFGRLPGSLGVITVIVSMILSSIQGSSAATAAALGKVGTEGMKKQGYKEEFAASLIAASGGLAIMIPPSIAMIIYGVLSNTSIGKLFYGGVIPGILIGIALMSYIIIVSYRRKYGRLTTKLSTKNKLQLFFKSIPILVFPIIVLFCFYTGVLTATEVAAISVFYSFIIGIFIYKTINLKNTFTILRRSTEITISIFIIISGAILFQHVLLLSGFVSTILSIVRNSSLTPVEFLIIASIILYFLGMFMEGVSLNVLTTPILAPIAASLGISLVHYGIVLVLNIEIALISPPVGLNLFILSEVTEISVEKMYRAVWPVLLILILCLIIIILFPCITTFLPNMLIRK